MVAPNVGALTCSRLKKNGEGLSSVWGRGFDTIAHGPPRITSDHFGGETVEGAWPCEEGPSRPHSLPQRWLEPQVCPSQPGAGSCWRGSRREPSWGPRRSLACGCAAAASASVLLWPLCLSFSVSCSLAALGTLPQGGNLLSSPLTSGPPFHQRRPCFQTRAVWGSQWTQWGGRGCWRAS